MSADHRAPGTSPEQDELAKQLASSPDPHVRIIAHMSNRQLALSEQLSETTQSLFRLASAVHGVQQQVTVASAELRRIGDEVVSLSESVRLLTSSINTLIVRHTELEERTKALETSFVADTTTMV